MEGARGNMKQIAAIKEKGGKRTVISKVAKSPRLCFGNVRWRRWRDKVEEDDGSE